MGKNVAVNNVTNQAIENSVNLPQIVIIGGGFGGLFAAKALNSARAKITVIDRTNHHLFQPLLYQVATGSLTAPAVAAPIRNILADQKNVTVICGNAEFIDITRRVIVLDGNDEISYDYLIIAAGATNNYFGNNAWEQYAPSLKTLDDAYTIRRRVLLAFEHAERETDAAKRITWLTFVVIGAGATGVELAGAFAEIARHTLRGEFRNFDPRTARVVLVEGGERVLPTYPASLSERARLQLEHIGVTVWLGKRVTGIDASGVQLGDVHLAARTVVWAAGVAASPLGATLGVPIDRTGRVVVDENLSVPDHPEIFVIGDLAALPWHQPAVPGIAPAAKQMGIYVAENIKKRLNLQTVKPKSFRYRDYGTLATIGRNAAVAEFGKVRLSGYFAWLLWLLAHIYFLIGFRNRIMVLIDWALAYWTFERNARIVTGDNNDSDNNADKSAVK